LNYITNETNRQIHNLHIKHDAKAAVHDATISAQKHQSNDKLVWGFGFNE